MAILGIFVNAAGPLDLALSASRQGGLLELALLEKTMDN